MEQHPICPECGIRRDIKQRHQVGCSLVQRTLAIIKPDASSNYQVWQAIFDRINQSPLIPLWMRGMTLTRRVAEIFYEEHRGKPFFEALVNFMSSRPITIFALEGENAVDVWRKMMGATNPRLAEPGTIRRDFGELPPENASIFVRNVVHGSDSIQAAEREIDFFFNADNLLLSISE